MNMWDDKNNAGGSIIDPLNSKTIKNIPVPSIQNLIGSNNHSVIGFFSIKKIRRSKTFSKGYFDIDILLVAPNHWTSDMKIEA